MKPYSLLLLATCCTPIRDKSKYIRVLLYSYYTTIAGWGVLLRNRRSFSPVFY